MILRLTHVALSFLIVFGVYWAYALSIVPLIEPSAEVMPQIEITQDPRKPAPTNSADGNRDFLQKHFNPGDWELQNPKVLDNEHGKLLVREYQTLPDGRVKLIPCTMIFFPKGQSTKSEPIIMQAPEATLQFDSPFDLKRGKIGKLIAGDLLGLIKIHSRPSRPGAEDDLYIETHDVRMADDQVWTEAPVVFRLGSSHGSGREMKMGLAPPNEGEESKNSNLRVGALEWMELEHDVKMHMQTSGNTLLPGDDRQQPAANAAARPAQAPVEIQCQGPFRFDLVQNVATYTHLVDVRQLNAEGPNDQMNCELLAIYFTPRDRKSAAAADKAGAEKREGSQGAMPNLEPRLVEATGDPVIINSPSNAGHARCQRLQYEVKTKRIVLEGSNEVQLNYQGSNEIHARRIDYQPGPTGGLGQLEATGPVHIQGADAQNPARKYQAHGSRSLSVRLDNKLHVVSLLGAAQVRMSQTGSLDGDEIHLWLRDDPNPRPNFERARPQIQPVSFAKPQPGGMSMDRMVPERMLAQGHVHIDSPQVIGDTRKLEVWFEDEPPSSAADRRGNRPPQGFFGPGNAQRANDPQSGVPHAPPQQYKVAGDLLRVQAVRGKSLEAADVQIDGKASVHETRTPSPGEKPLTVLGDKIHVAEANTPDSRVTVVGKSAFIETRGFSLTGGKIELERSTNRAWVEGPGRMTMPVKPDASGHALMQTQSMEITWQGGMTFDGQTAVFDRTVVVRGDHQTLGTPHMEVKLRKRIDFGAAKLPANDSRESLIGEIYCRDGFVMDSRSADEHGQTGVQHMEARDLLVNNVTGAIQGHGPGLLTSVSLSSATAALAPGAPQPAAPRNQPGNQPASPRLNYIQVLFEGPIGGNLARNEVTFSDQVRAVYGPVLDWTQKLDGDDPEKLGPEGVVLTCDQLVVRTTPGVAKPSSDAVELEAVGNTRVDGAKFTALAHRITYTKMKDLLVLEGDDQTAAQLMSPSPNGGQPNTLRADSIMYWPSTKGIRGFGLRGGDVDLGADKQTPGKPQANPAAPLNRKQKAVNGLRNGNAVPPKNNSQ